MKTSQPGVVARVPLTRERVLAGAAEIADGSGIGALTMRSLAHALGAKPMSLYHHVANKDEILDALVDLVFSEVEVPSEAPDGWRAAMEARAHGMRAALARHPWAVGLMETRTTPGAANLRHHNATLGVLRRSGFSLDAAGHAYALMDSYIYGFALQEAGLPVGKPDSDPQVVQAMARSIPADELPYLAEMAMDRALQPNYRFSAEFDVGLAIILDGLAGLLPQHPERLLNNPT
ncbi:TetR/AcrR family transcriptional regulator C-terminal domain-containing protein [Arthrobacter sp. zg-ZUI100]|uniref:TetR/AcrR family transcriptional regulator n=1 Tax=Arthrobacter jiangjiafuii TaxID=2817475 RepID=UPI001AEF06F2|nr:TetR/AcrR family transcriptional regulator C-terminal domain-containing protein [Arthrobacter jiangjiafuii]MBP3037492.1 TetR/AcrR family transcriptional regulator C-terminal domain-containing protein [Arthrobacter jiangjiafuii]